MEGINKTLFEELKDSASFKEEYSLKSKIEKFLELDSDNYEKRQNLALEASSDILYAHSKEDLPYIAISLAKLERNLTDIQPYQRDHVCHSLLTFLLGYFMILKLDLQRSFFDFPFQWKLAALLHDIGYSLEIVDRISNEFFEMYEKDILQKKWDFNSSQTRHLTKYLNLYTKDESQNRNTLDILNDRLRRWQISLDAKNVFIRMLGSQKFDDKPRRTDHGIVSSILVMKAIDEKYRIRNPNQISDPNNPWSFSNMTEQITNVCSAIFVHNLEANNLVWNFTENPLATLLKISDALQCWGRPSAKEPKGDSPEDYDLNFQNGKIIFYAKKDKVKSFKTKIENTIHFPIVIQDLL